MAAPEYVPNDARARLRAYRSNPRRPESWHADRPGDLPDGQPRGERFGSPGPDLGYALKIARSFDDRLRLADGEHRDDAVAGCVALAMKRSSLFGRAPVIHDLTVAFTVWGFLDDDPADDLLALRRKAFEGVANPHHYVVLRDLVDAVPLSTLRLTPARATEAHRVGWRSLFDLPA